MNSVGPKEGEAREQENNRALCKFKEYNIPYPFLWFSRGLSSFQPLEQRPLCIFEIV